MNSWLLLVFTLAVPLSTSRTGAQFTTSSSSSSPNITNITTNTTTATTNTTTTATTNTTTDQTTDTYSTNTASTTSTTPLNTVSGGIIVDTTTTPSSTTGSHPPHTTNSIPSTNTPSSTTGSHPPHTTNSIPSTNTPSSTTGSHPPHTTNSIPSTNTPSSTTGSHPPHTTNSIPSTTTPSSTTDFHPPHTTNSTPTTTTAPPDTPSPPPSTNTTNTSTPFTTTPLPTTLTSSPAPPGPTTPLVCENGGMLFQGVCICPDEWTGETCSQENFCPAQQLDGFNFPRSPIGWFAYSEEICPQGTKGAGKPQATTRCITMNGSPSFERAQEFKCDQTLSDLQQNLTSPADFQSLATSAQILTSKPEELTAEDITAAAQIANTLLQSPNATESVRVAAVATVSQLLNTSTPDDGTENNATLGLTVTLDELSVSLSLTTDTSASQMVQPNLAVQSAQVPAADTRGVQFTSLSGTSGSFVANRIKLNTNTSSVVVDDGGIADVLIYVRFPPEAVTGRQKPSNVSLGFVLYQNDHFFHSRRYKSKRSNIRVLSGSVSGQERSVVPQHVEMMFRPTIPNGKRLYDFACVFWNYSINDWSTDGCSKGNASDGRLGCFCNHTTNFAALFSLRETYKYAALDWISVVGLSISIICLIITIIHHISDMLKKEADNMKTKIAQLCIYTSLLAFIVTFVSGSIHTNKPYDAPVEINTRAYTIPESDERVEPDRGSCSAVTALLHFFLLANFMWNSLQGTLLLLVQMNSLPSYWTPLSFAVGWGVPAVVMAITLGATYRVDNPLGYRQEEFCWLAALDKTKQFDFGKPMFGAFLLPVGLSMIYNIVLLVMVAWKDLKQKEHRAALSKFLFTFSLLVVMGVSWTLGYLVLVTEGHAQLALSIIFCLCTSTQGLQIFILVTARQQSFRDIVFQSARFVSSNVSRSPQYISSMASRSAQSASSMASRSAQSVSSMASRSAQRISSINIGIKRGKYRFNMNTESTAGDDYFRFHEEPITLVEFSAAES